MSFTLANRRREIEAEIQKKEAWSRTLVEQASPFQGPTWEHIRKMAEERVQTLSAQLLEGESKSLDEIRLLQGEGQGWRKILSLPKTVEANMAAVRGEIADLRKKLEGMTHG